MCALNPKPQLANYRCFPQGQKNTPSEVLNYFMVVQFHQNTFRFVVQASNKIKEEKTGCCRIMPLKKKCTWRRASREATEKNKKTAILSAITVVSNTIRSGLYNL